MKFKIYLILTYSIMFEINLWLLTLFQNKRKCKNIKHLIYLLTIYSTYVRRKVGGPLYTLKKNLKIQLQFLIINNI